MNSKTGVTAPQASAVFWIVAAGSLVWALVADMNYLAAFLARPEWLLSLPADTLNAIHLVPLWGRAAWTVGAWGALIGSLLMLARRHEACAAFGISLAGLAMSTVCQATTPLPPSLSIGSMLMATAGNWAVALFLTVYSYHLRDRGVLR